MGGIGCYIRYLAIKLAALAFFTFLAIELLCYFSADCLFIFKKQTVKMDGSGGYEDDT